MAKKEKIGECVYCGRLEEMTTDHIPPKNLFPSPRPNNLITVPSCKKCNQKASKDDEYFRLVLSMRQEVSGHPEILKNNEKLRRSLWRPEQKGFRVSFLNSLKNVDLYTPAGIYLGKTSAFRVDMKRVNAVIKRIAKGIFYEEKGIRLPDNYQIRAYCINDIINEQPYFLGTLIIKRDIIPLTLQGKKQTVDENIFKYWYQFAIDEENSGVIIFSFYNRVSFLVLITPDKITVQN